MDRAKLFSYQPSPTKPSARSQTNRRDSRGGHSTGRSNGSSSFAHTDYDHPVDITMASSSNSSGWNPRDEIPSGTVRNNPFLPKQPPPPEPEPLQDQLKFKNQWDASRDIPRGMVQAARMGMRTGGGSRYRDGSSAATSSEQQGRYASDASSSAASSNRNTFRDDGFHDVSEMESNGRSYGQPKYQPKQQPKHQNRQQQHQQQQYQQQYQQQRQLSSNRRQRGSQPSPVVNYLEPKNYSTGRGAPLQASSKQQPSAMNANGSSWTGRSNSGNRPNNRQPGPSPVPVDTTGFPTDAFSTDNTDSTASWTMRGRLMEDDQMAMAAQGNNNNNSSNRSTNASESTDSSWQVSTEIPEGTVRHNKFLNNNNKSQPPGPRTAAPSKASRRWQQPSVSTSAANAHYATAAGSQDNSNNSHRQGFRSPRKAGQTSTPGLGPPINAGNGSHDSDDFGQWNNPPAGEEDDNTWMVQGTFTVDDADDPDLMPAATDDSDLFQGIDAYGSPVTEEKKLESDIPPPTMPPSAATKNTLGDARNAQHSIAQSSQGATGYFPDDTDDYTTAAASLAAFRDRDVLEQAKRKKMSRGGALGVPSAPHVSTSNPQQQQPWQSQQTSSSLATNDGFNDSFGNAPQPFEVARKSELSMQTTSSHSTDKHERRKSVDRISDDRSSLRYEDDRVAAAATKQKQQQVAPVSLRTAKTKTTPAPAPAAVVTQPTPNTKSKKKGMSGILKFFGGGKKDKKRNSGGGGAFRRKQQSSSSMASKESKRVPNAPGTAPKPSSSVVANANNSSSNNSTSSSTKGSRVSALKKAWSPAKASVHSKQQPQATPAQPAAVSENAPSHARPRDMRISSSSNNNNSGDSQIMDEDTTMVSEITMPRQAAPVVVDISQVDELQPQAQPRVSPKAHLSITTDQNGNRKYDVVDFDKVEQNSDRKDGGDRGDGTTSDDAFNINSPVFSDGDPFTSTSAIAPAAAALSKALNSNIQNSSFPSSEERRSPVARQVVVDTSMAHSRLAVADDTATKTSPSRSMLQQQRRQGEEAPQTEVPATRATVAAGASPGRAVMAEDPSDPALDHLAMMSSSDSDADDSEGDDLAKQQPIAPDLQDDEVFRDMQITMPPPPPPGPPPPKRMPTQDSQPQQPQPQANEMVTHPDEPSAATVDHSEQSEEDSLSAAAPTRRASGRDASSVSSGSTSRSLSLRRRPAGRRHPLHTVPDTSSPAADGGGVAGVGALTLTPPRATAEAAIGSGKNSSAKSQEHLSPNANVSPRHKIRMRQRSKPSADNLINPPKIERMTKATLPPSQAPASAAATTVQSARSQDDTSIKQSLSGEKNKLARLRRDSRIRSHLSSKRGSGGVDDNDTTASSTSNSNSSSGIDAESRSLRATSTRKNSKLNANRGSGVTVPQSDGSDPSAHHDSDSNSTGTQNTYRANKQRGFNSKAILSQQNQRLRQKQHQHQQPTRTSNMVEASKKGHSRSSSSLRTLSSNGSRGSGSHKNSRDNTDASVRSIASSNSNHSSSDIRVLRSILRRPRGAHPQPKPIVRRKQPGYTTYDESNITDPMQRAGLRLLSAAIMPIQTEVRRFLAMRHALTRMWALIVIQTYTRRWIARRHYDKCQRAIIKMQAVVRGDMARMDIMYKHACAMEIQRVVRGYLATMRVYEDIVKVTMVQSIIRRRQAIDKATYRLAFVIQLQSIARSWLARQQMAREQRSAIMIQAKWRCFFERLSYQFDLLDVIIVQSAWRQRAATKAVAQRRLEHHNCCATKIQSQWKSYDCTMNYLHFLADVLIAQSAVRRFLALKRVERMKRSAAITIQTIWRGYSCVLHKKRYLAARTIQSAARGFNCFNRYYDYMAARWIQSCWRRHVLETKYTRYMAVRTIQTSWRRHVCETKYTRYMAVRTIQTSWRRHVLETDYNEYVAARMVQTAWRRHVLQTDFTEFTAARKIQKHWRRVACELLYTQHLAAKTIQTSYRRRVCEVDYQEYMAARKIQAQWRRCVDEIAYIEYLSARSIQSQWRRLSCQIALGKFLAASSIQACWRRLLCERKYAKYIAARTIQTSLRRRESQKLLGKHKAARSIQAAWRRCVCYDDYTDYMSTRKIQTAWRRAMCQGRYREYTAARKIQTVWRGFVCYADYMFTVSDIITTQKVARSFLAKQVLKNLRFKKEIAAAKVVQRHWREFRCARCIQRAWRLKMFVGQRHEASIVIQKTWRGFMDQTEFVVAKYEHYAARTIQTGWRRFWAFSNFIIALDCTIQIQAVARGHLQRKALLNQHESAAVIQCYFRRLQGADEAAHIRTVQAVESSSIVISAKENYFATTIQKNFRGFLLRSRLKLYCSARSIQAVVRGVQARTAINMYVSARKIQKIWRGYLPCISYRTYISARRIQTFWRGKHHRNAYMHYRAALRIQTNYRGVKAREDVLILRGEILAATLIQSAWRGFVSYTDYIFTVADVVTVQRIARGFVTRVTTGKELKRMIQQKRTENDASIQIQRACRGFIARQRYWYTLGCTMQIQSWLRGRLVMVMLEKQHRARLKLQSFGRYIIARQEFLQRKFIMMLISTSRKEKEKRVAALVIQDRWRSKQERDDRERGARVIQRFFLMVKKEVDREIRAAKKRKTWRKKLKHRSNKIEDALLEDAWRSAVVDRTADDASVYSQLSGLTSAPKYRRRHRRGRQSSSSRTVSGGDGGEGAERTSTMVRQYGSRHESHDDQYYQQQHDHYGQHANQHRYDHDSPTAMEEAKQQRPHRSSSRARSRSRTRTRSHSQSNVRQPTQQQSPDRRRGSRSRSMSRSSNHQQSHKQQHREQQHGGGRSSIRGKMRERFDQQRQLHQYTKRQPVLNPAFSMPDETKVQRSGGVVRVNEDDQTVFSGLTEQTGMPFPYASHSHGDNNKHLRPHYHHPYQQQQQYPHQSSSDRYSHRPLRIPPSRSLALSTTEIDEDFDLEEAFIDAEILNAKERRKMNSQQRSGSNNGGFADTPSSSANGRHGRQQQQQQQYHSYPSPHGRGVPPPPPSASTKNRHRISSRSSSPYHHEI